MATWLTSDMHLSQLGVSTRRGFVTVEEHDNTIERNIKKLVADTDTLWILGDIAVGDWRAALERIAAWPGEKHLILGNHDRAHPGNSQGHAYQHEYLNTFRSIGTSAELRDSGNRYMLSHFPYDGEGQRTGPERFTEWRLRDEGKWLVHGHTHSKERVSLSAKGTMQINVAVDAWDMKPVNLGWLKASVDI